ncbi:MAG: helix-turn-helix domain-containing protein [Candidatus Melainabacteria bacterium]|jgi:transcriptional regulator with XRE-family HTH domain|nr:helix-turn-helix domain-containing protein [Candidatus Melainabacteria bacterium]
MFHFGLATSDETAVELAARLRAHRLLQNLQQSELAARAGISRKTLTTFEHSGKVSLDVFLRIVAALGLSESLSPLFEPRQKSIRDMELAAQQRQRASRKRK